MKRYKLIVFFLVIVVILSIVSVAVSAEQPRLELQPYSDEEMTVFFENFTVDLCDSIPEKGICCFDVNENGLVVLGFDDSSNKAIIGVYSDDGQFVRGYKFTVIGTFSVGIDGDSIVIYKTRGDNAIYVSPDGEVQNVYHIVDSENNDEYLRRYVSSPIRKVGGKTYYLRNDMGILNGITESYSQLVAVNENGEATILYDVNEQLFKKRVIIVSLVIVGIIIVICITIYRIIQIRRVWQERHPI